MKLIKRVYYRYKIRNARNDIDFLKGLHCASEYELKDNISYIRNKAKLEYYTTLLSVVSY